MSLREQRYQQKLQQRQGRLQAGGGAFDAQYGLNGAPPSFKHSTFHHRLAVHMLVITWAREWCQRMVEHTTSVDIMGKLTLAEMRKVTSDQA